MSKKSGRIPSRAMEEKTQHLYGFGPFRLDPKECLLILDGRPVPLPPKAFEALLFLVENAGHLVEKMS